MGMRMGDSSMCNENIPDHMLQEKGNNFRLPCLVIKCNELLEVCGEFGLVYCCGERMLVCLPVCHSLRHVEWPLLFF